MSCRIESEMTEAGGGRSSLITSATNAIRRGLRLDPVPLKKHDEKYKADFERAYIRAVRKLQDEKQSYNISDFSNEATRLFQLYMARSYVAGLQTISPTATFSDTDYDTLQELVRKQEMFARNFGNDVQFKAGKMNYVQRARMYSASLDHAFQAAVLSRLKPNVLIYWRLNPAEHCKDCIELADKSPYRPDELRQVQPRSGHTRCMSNCRCHLEITTRLKVAVSRVMGRVAQFLG